MPKLPSELLAGSGAQPSNKAGMIGNVIVLALLCAVGYAFISRSDFGGWFKQDYHEQQQDDKKHDGKLVVKPGVLFLIHDMAAAPVDRMLLIDEVKAMRKANSGFEYRVLDDDKDDSPETTQIKNFAKEKGIDPPFVAFKPAGAKLKTAIGWPKDKSALMEVFK